MVNTYHASAEGGTILNLEICGRPPFNFRRICDQSFAQFGSKGIYINMMIVNSLRSFHTGQSGHMSPWKEW